jgi:hypothetical protein
LRKLATRTDRANASVPSGIGERDLFFGLSLAHKFASCFELVTAFASPDSDATLVFHDLFLVLVDLSLLGIEALVSLLMSTARTRFRRRRVDASWSGP